ncbi:hypothetical protein V6R21_09105 [Limibacter armeniacum]|uniref:hypothetical protein n=1 Tax=Limibacter armeniacum TaxID=466084 RepID=UPI002FE60FE5
MSNSSNDNMNDMFRDFVRDMIQEGLGQMKDGRFNKATFENAFERFQHMAEDVQKQAESTKKKAEETVDIEIEELIGKKNRSGDDPKKVKVEIKTGKHKHHNGENSDYSEVTYLKEQVEMLKQQLKDKDDIIQLLKEQVDILKR